MWGQICYRHLAAVVVLVGSMSQAAQAQVSIPEKVTDDSLLAKAELFMTIPALAVGRTHPLPDTWRWAVYDGFAQELHQGGTHGNLLAGTTALAHGDIDGDGRDELAVGNDGTLGARWTIYDEPLTRFTAMALGGETWDAGRYVTALSFGDMDGDGRDELAVGRQSADGLRWAVYDDTSANFAELMVGGESWGPNRYVTALASGDINGDDVDDLAVGRNGPDGLRWAVYAGAGDSPDKAKNFSELVTGGETWGVNRHVTALAMGDVDDDGVDELAVGRTGPDGLRWAIYDDASAGFAELVTGGHSWGTDRHVTALAMGDVDSDGIDELVVGRNGPDGLRWVVYDDATASFTELAFGGEDWESDRHVTALALGDLDQDRFDELVVGRNPGPGMHWTIYDDTSTKFEPLIAVEGDASAGITALSIGDAGICGDHDDSDQVTKKYCLSGTPRGAGYAWEVSGRGFSFEEMYASPVSATGDATDLSAAFVDSLNSVGCFDHAAIDPDQPECFEITVRGAADFDLTVGPLQSPNCEVTRALLDGGKPGGCTYNPTIIHVDDSYDCNINGVDDVVDISGGFSTDLNSNLMPDECEVGVALSLVGTALGGEVTVVVDGPSTTCTVTIATEADDSAETVAAALLSALLADTCLADRRTSAVLSGSTLTLTGFRLGESEISATTTDPGLRILTPLIIPTLDSLGLLLMPLLLLVLGVFVLRRRRSPQLPFS